MILRQHTAGSRALMLLGTSLMAALLGATGMRAGGLPTSIVDLSIFGCGAILLMATKLMKPSIDTKRVKVPARHLAVKIIAVAIGIAAVLASSMVALLMPGSYLARATLPFTLPTMVVGMAVVVLTPLA